MRRTALVLLALPLAGAMRAKTETEMVANPVRKVVTMLQSMQKKVAEEGEKEKELYERFMCFCKDGGAKLSSSISAAETKIPAVSSDLEEAEGKLTQTKEEVKQAQTDRANAKDAVKEATAIREKEAAAYAAEKSELDTNIAAVAKAVAALEKGAEGSFLQSSDASVIQQMLSKAGLAEPDRVQVASFLAGTYAPQSGEVTGILKQMGDTMAKSLSDATAAEEAAIKAYEELMAAKAKEIKTLTAAIETKMKQIGDLGVAIVAMKEDIEDTTATLAEDKKFLANMKEDCATKTAEWEERSKTRADELVALGDTIKILNDDDALELFKKTLPGPGASFVQVATTSASMRSEALQVLRRARGGLRTSERAGLDKIVLALVSRKAVSKGVFDKVITMIDTMVGVLKDEQRDDDDKKEYCEKQLDLADDKKKALERTFDDMHNAIIAAKDAIETLTEEIAALTEGIKDLDQSVSEATDQRKKENAEYKELMASDTAAKELLDIAKNRLNKFYNPKLYVAPKKEELSEGDRINQNFGGSFAQLSMRKGREAPPPPPATWDAYAKKGQESTGVIGMIDVLIKDLDKELTEAEAEEKNAQAEYEQMMEDSAEKRRVDSKSLAEKTALKADTETTLEDNKVKKKDTGMELMATMKYISSLHAECDWLIKYFDVRKEARDGEVDALKKAKAVLSGADYSF